MRDSERMLNGRGRKNGISIQSACRMWTDTDYALEVGARIECVVEPAEDEWGVIVDVQESMADTR